MSKRLFVLFIFALFLLTACSGAEQVPASDDPAPEAQPQPTEVEPMEVVPTQPEATETSAPASGGDVSKVGLQMECTLVSDQPEAPAELVAVFGVKDDDWVEGPETAALTIVEYSDFQ
jgi:hypothetical protein